MIGLILHVFFNALARTPFLAEIFLFTTNSVVLYTVLSETRRSSLVIWSLTILVFTFLTEAAGVATGFVFGNYVYGEGMRIKLLGVPLIIAYNWLILIFGALNISARLSMNKNLVPLIAALIIMLFDFIMEPVAVRLDYWQWEGNAIPLRNYIAWGLITWLCSYPLVRINLVPGSVMVRLLFLSQALFFLLLRFFMP